MNRITPSESSSFFIDWESAAWLMAITLAAWEREPISATARNAGTFSKWRQSGSLNISKSDSTYKKNNLYLYPPAR